MDKHKSTLVPINTWSYASPEIRAKGHILDIGLFAEALLYYDTVILSPSNEDVFFELIKYFHNLNKLDLFYGLLKDGIVQIYNYDFLSTAINHKGKYSIWNVQDEEQKKSSTFVKRYLYNSSIQNLLKKSRQREKLYKSINGNFIEGKAEEYESAVFNARVDMDNHERHALIVQSYLDDLYKFKELGKAPKVEVIIDSINEDSNSIRWNVDFSKISDISGTGLNFQVSTPFLALATANKFIWSAATMNSDLFLPSPISKIVGDKLFESSSKTVKTSKVLQLLKEKVEFTDIRFLVNSGKLDIVDIMKIRSNSQKFRKWLQQESDRDRDAIIAYHQEVMKENKLEKFGRKALKLFGVVGGIVIGNSVAGPHGSIIGGVAGTGFSYLYDVASKIDSDWKPVVFGNWLNDQVDNISKR